LCEGLERHFSSLPAAPGPVLRSLTLAGMLANATFTEA
jgi:hypothetical protein